jgi:lipopolysaccharide heptosyltransferase I
MPDPKFLVVRLSSLGDSVHTFPAVAALRESFPNEEIVWLAHPRWKLLVESSGLASEVWTIETRSWSSLQAMVRKIRERKFTAAVDYQGLWKSAALPFFGSIPRRIGFSSQTIREFGVPILYTDRVRITKTHIADQNGELSLRGGARKLVSAFNLHIESREMVIVEQLLRGAAVDRYVVLSPGGGWASKCWPPQRFGQLCQKISQQLGLRCVLNCGPGEDHLISEIKAASGDSSPIEWKLPLEQLMALLRNAACIVGGDTGPLHLAVALGTPAVALFGPTDPARNGPYRLNDSPAVPRRDIVLRSPRAVTSYKRGSHPDPSTLDLEVDAVFEAVRRVVEARA